MLNKNFYKIVGCSFLIMFGVLGFMSFTRAAVVVGTEDWGFCIGEDGSIGVRVGGAGGTTGGVCGGAGVNPLIGPRYIPPGYYGGPVNTARGFVSLLSIILGWVQAVFWIAAVASGLYAAYLYLLSSGDPEKVKKATKQIVYTVVAVVVAILAYAVPAILDNFFFGA